MTTLITTPFGFNSTAAEVLDGVDLSGKRAVVTGAASGIGIETARALAGAGAAVTLAVRDVDRGSEVAADISQLVPIDQAAGMTSLDPDVTAGAVATNQFIDPTVGLTR